MRVATGREHNHLLITNQRSTDVVARRPSVIDSHTAFANTPYPRKGYTYARGSSINSVEGLGFERRYVRVILGCLRRWGLLAWRKTPRTPETERRHGRLSDGSPA